ncbi:MAG: Not1 N-terminal domain, CCR4-Not complex component-domain-containing protein, partial [Piptocephalis tieghemiana]
EIDRVIKKVDEGIEGFVELMDKMNTTTNPSQKEKLEGESKREIKKLQRLRDQIKTWQTSNDIKDKNLLNQYRRRIEEQMETFKVVEKELKTKAFSKEGLNLAAKIDPKDREKQQLASWIASQVEELTTQVERAEAEQESLQAQGRKAKRDSAKAARIDELEHLNERRKWHCSRLELCQRLIQNGSLAMERFREIKDDIEYYVESNDEPDFEEDDEVYTVLGLEDEEDTYLISSEIFGSGSSNGPNPSQPDSLEPSEPSESSEPSSSGKRSNSLGTEPHSYKSSSSPSSSDADSGGLKAIPTSRSSSSSSSSSSLSSSTSSSTSTGQITTPRKSTSVPTIASSLPDDKRDKDSTDSIPTTTTTTTSSKIRSHPALDGSSVGSLVPSGGTTSKSDLSSSSPSHSTSQMRKGSHVGLSLAQGKSGEPQARRLPPSSSGKPLDIKGGIPPPPSISSTASTSSSISSTTSSSPSSSTPATPTRISTYSQTVQSGLDLPTSSSPQQTKATLSPREAKAPLASTASQSSSDQTPTSSSSTETSSTSIHPQLNPILGDLLASFDTAQKNALSLEKALAPPLLSVQQALEAAYLQLPKRGDLLRTLPKYTPAQPFPNSPPYYPSQPPPMIPDAFYATVDLDTLFFIFYYRPGSHEQYRAAKEIKRRGWRFNTKHLAWFLRASPSTSASPGIDSGEQAPPLPRQVTDTYEQGVYEVFDYEGAWCKRKKADFRSVPPSFILCACGGD